MLKLKSFNTCETDNFPIILVNTEVDYYRGLARDVTTLRSGSPKYTSDGSFVNESVHRAGSPR